MSVSFDSSRVTLVDHPLVQHKLTIMRDERTRFETVPRAR